MDLTRKIVVFEATEDTVLDYNYHYELMKEVYKSLEVVNSLEAFQMHEEGFLIENKRYKLFTHQLFIEKANYIKNGIEIKKGTRCYLTVSGLNKVVKSIVLGFVKKGSLELFNKHYKIIEVKADKRVKFDNITLYKTRNPVVATIQNEEKKIVYTSPFDESFYRVIANNLKRKYKLIYNKEYEGELYFDIEDTFSIKKRLISNIKSKGMLIGYSNFELYIIADKDMQKVAYYCGIGSNNSLGMGMMTYITSRRD